ncbi:hypothetical protein ACH42_05110 [Endozoicomonas sp. (ex Bugula neritina AB1)]|nr:hypothetical protein ACH42_05110 [Endozoicomonas sp. (ex Bugula neritina AB1)]
MINWLSPCIIFIIFSGTLLAEDSERPVAHANQVRHEAEAMLVSLSNGRKCSLEFGLNQQKLPLMDWWSLFFSFSSSLPLQSQFPVLLPKRIQPYLNRNPSDADESDVKQALPYEGYKSTFILDSLADFLLSDTDFGDLKGSFESSYIQWYLQYNAPLVREPVSVFFTTGENLKIAIALPENLSSFYRRKIAQSVMDQLLDFLDWLLLEVGQLLDSASARELAINISGDNTFRPPYEPDDKIWFLNPDETMLSDENLNVKINKLRWRLALLQEVTGRGIIDARVGLLKNQVFHIFQDINRLSNPGKGLNSGGANSLISDLFSLYVLSDKLSEIPKTRQQPGPPPEQSRKSEPADTRAQHSGMNNNNRDKSSEGNHFGGRINNGRETGSEREPDPHQPPASNETSGVTQNHIDRFINAAYFGNVRAMQNYWLQAHPHGYEQLLTGRHSRSGKSALYAATQSVSNSKDNVIRELIKMINSVNPGLLSNIFQQDQRLLSQSDGSAYELMVHTALQRYRQPLGAIIDNRTNFQTETGHDINELSSIIPTMDTGSPAGASNDGVD